MAYDVQKVGKVVQVINLNVMNSILKPLDQMLVALFGSLLPLCIGIPTKPNKRYATRLLLHLCIPYATTQQVLTTKDINPTASYYILE